MPKIISSELPEVKFRNRFVKGVSLYVKEDAMMSMIDHADAGLSENKEVMGLMTGRIFADAEGTYVMVDDVATSELDADEASVRFREEGLEELFGSIDSCKGDAIVGWYHSHLGIGCYLSEVDIRTHDGIFGKDLGYAIVIDPIDSEVVPFTCIDKKPQKVSMLIITD